jgi:hypothetical protein
MSTQLISSLFAPSAISATEVPCRRRGVPAPESFTRTEFEFAISPTRSRYEAQIVGKSRRVLKRPHGEVPGFTIRDLTEKQRHRLYAELSKRRCSSIAELLQRKAAKAPKYPLVFDAMPASIQAKAHSLREVLNRYFFALDCGETEKTANQMARRKWTAIFSGVPTTEKTIRRRASLIWESGGPTLAPMIAYVDQKTVPHYHANKKLTPLSIVQRALSYSVRLHAIAKADIRASQKIEAAALIVLGLPIEKCRLLKIVTEGRELHGRAT